MIAAGVVPEGLTCDWLFCCNERRVGQIAGRKESRLIVTSNIKGAEVADALRVNYATYLMGNSIIAANPVLMLFKLLIAMGIKKAAVAGFDGYRLAAADNYCDPRLAMGSSVSNKVERNALIAEAVKELSRRIDIEFVTESLYTEK